MKAVKELIETWKARAKTLRTMSHPRHPQHTRDAITADTLEACATELQQALGQAGGMAARQAMLRDRVDAFLHLHPKEDLNTLAETLKAEGVYSKKTYLGDITGRLRKMAERMECEKENWKGHLRDRSDNNAT